MLRHKKIKAFTLSEVIIAMVISSIVAGLAFTILALVQRHIWSIQTNYNSSNTINNLETVLWLDLNRFENINYSENTLVLESSLDLVNYQFSKKYIIRLKDTFNLENIERKLFFNGSEITSGKLDGIALKDTLRNQTVFIYKRNTANTYMN